MSALSDALAGRSRDGLSSILAQLNTLLRPTEQLPGTQSPYSVLLAQPGMVSRAAPMAAPGSSNGSAGGSQGSSSSLQGLLKEAGPLKSALSSLFGPSLATYASGAPADSAVTAALGNVGAQTAPTAASIQAGNDAALAASDGGAAGASAGLLGMGQIGSGLAADSAVTGTLGSVGAQTAGEAAAIQAANDAALGGSAAASGGSGAAAGAGLGAGAGAATALGAAALPLALAAFVPYNSGFSGPEVQGMLNDISAATKANGGLLNAGSGISNGVVSNPQLANAFQDLTTLIGDNPDEFSKSGGTSPIVQQLTAMGYGGLLGGSSPITAPLGGKNNWMGNNVFGRSSGRQVMA